MKTTNRFLDVRKLLFLGVTATLFAATPPVFGASDTWSGASATSGNWSDPGNWNTLPGSGDLLFFAGTTQLSDTNDFSGYTFNGVTFNSGAGAFVLYGNPFSLAGGITNLTTTAPTINNNITLTGNETVSDTGSGTLTLGGVIGDGGNGYGLSFPGNHNVTITNANTCSGTNYIYGGGTVAFTYAGGFSNGTIVLGKTGSSAAAYLTIGGNTLPVGTTMIASNLVVDASILGGQNFNNLNCSGSSAGNIIMQFNGALQLNTGLLRISPAPNAAGNLQLSFNSFTRNPGTLFDMNNGTAPGANPIASQTANSANIVFNTPPTLSGSGSIGAVTCPIVPGVLVSQGPGTYDSTYGLRGLGAGEVTTFAAANGVTGTPAPNVLWSVNAGQTLTGDTEMNSLHMNESQTISLAGHTLTIDSGWVSSQVNGVIGASVNDGFLALGAEGTFFVSQARTMTVNSVITGSGGLTIDICDVSSTAGNCVLAGANTFTGVTRVLGDNGLQVHINNGLALQNSTLDYNNYGGTITFSSSPGSFVFGGLEGAQNLGIAYPLTVGGDGDSTTYGGVLSAAGSLTKTGSGAFTLTGASTYSGGTTLSNGVLNINYGGSSSANSAIGVAAFTIAGGSIDNTSGSTVTLAPNNAQNWNGDFTFIGTGNLNLGTGLVALGGSRQVTVNANALSVGGSISGTGFGLTKNGNGTLALSGADTYSGDTTINGGALALAGSGSIGNSTNITVGSGATLDVSAISFTLGGSQSLLGSGTNNGSVGSTSGSKVYAGTDGTYGTNTFNNNLTLASGAAAYFDLGTTASGSNDRIVVSGNLALNGNTIHIKAPSASVNLDANDYTLFTVNGGISGSAAVSPAWDVQPLNSANYSIVTSGNSVKLHYTVVSNPSGTGSASPNPVARNQSTLVTVTVSTPGSAPVSTVTVNASPVGGSSSVPLVEVGATASYTNTVTVGSGINAGSMPLTATITDTDSGSGSVMVPLTVSAGSVTWNGGGLDNIWSDTANWVGSVSPLGGDAVTFAGTTRLAPLMDNSFTISSLTFNSNAGSFVISNAPAAVLTLDGNGVTNNSPNTETVNVPIVMSTPQTFNTAAGSITVGGLVSGGSSLTKVGPGTNTLTLAGTNTYGGGTLVAAGTIAVANSSALGSGVITLGGGSISNAAGGSYTVANNITVSSAGSAGVASGDLLTLSGTISGGATLIKVGNGSLELPGANSISGGITVSSGTLIVANNNAIGSGLLTLGNASLSNSTGASYTIANPVNLSGSATTLVGGGDTLTLSGTIGGGGSLATAGNGTLTIAGSSANTYSGGTTLPAGFLNVENTSASPLGTNTLTFAGGSLEDNGPGVTISNNVYVATNTTTTLTTGGINLAGNISGPGNIVVGGGATQDFLSGSNSAFTGTLTVNNGTGQRFTFNSPSAGSPNANFVFNSTGVDNQKFTIGGTNTISFGSMSGNGYLRNDAGVGSYITLRVGDLNTSTVFNGFLAQGSGPAQVGLLKVGTGTLTMTNNEGYTGLTEIAGGGLDISVAQGASHSFQVDDGAALEIINYPGSGLYAQPPTLTVGTTNGATLAFTNLDASSPGGPYITSSFTNNGTCTVVITDTNNLAAGNTYPLILWGAYASSGAGNFVLYSSQIQGYVTNDLSAQELELVITGFGSLNPNPAPIAASVSGGNLILSWPADHTGWLLQAQTNSLASGLGANWVTIPGTDSSNSYTNVINPSSGSVFYRMILP